MNSRSRARPADKRGPRRKSTRALIKIHSVIGLISVVLIVVLVATGWALNHSDSLDLDDRYIKSEWMLNLYQISDEPGVQELSSQGIVLATIDDAVFVDAEFLLTSGDKMLGLVLFDEVVHLFSSSMVRLYTLQGTLIEAIALPVTISAVGMLLDNMALLKQQSGGIIGLHLDSFQIEEATLNSSTEWQVMENRPQPSYPSIIGEWRDRRITVEQSLLDIHSGRLFGSVGVWLIDLFGLLLLFLAFTGPVIWFRRKRRHSLKYSSRR